MWVALKSMLTVKHKAARFFNLVNLDGQQIALLGPPKCAGPFVGAILVGETQDPVAIDASLAFSVRRRTVGIRVSSRQRK